MAFVTDSNRPNRIGNLLQPPNCLWATSEVPSLLMHPWGGALGASIHQSGTLGNRRPEHLAQVAPSSARATGVVLSPGVGWTGIPRSGAWAGRPPGGGTTRLSHATPHETPKPQPCQGPASGTWCSDGGDGQSEGITGRPVGWLVGVGGGGGNPRETDCFQ